VVVGVLLDNALLKSVRDIRGILLGRRDPAIANEESFQAPWGCRVLLVAIEDGSGDVGNVLSSVGLACDVELFNLACWSIRKAQGYLHRRDRTVGRGQTTSRGI
jgi:hypothetical protein